MKHVLRKCISLVLLICLFILTSCSQGKPTEYVKERTSFDSYLTEIFQEIASTDTLTLNYTILDPSLYNIKKQQPTLGEFTIEEMENGYKKEIQYLKRLSKFNYEYLSSEQQLCYDQIKEDFLLDYKYRNYMLYHEVLGPTTGIQAQLPILLAEYNLYSKEDLDEYLSLLKDLPRYFRQICDFEIMKSKAGLFMTDDVALEIINQCNTFIEDSESNYLIDVVNDKISTLSFLTNVEKENYKSQNENYVVEFIIPAYEMLITTLKDLLGTGTNSNGLFYYKNGAKYYEYLVKSETGTSRSIEELIQMIENSLSDTLLDMRNCIHEDAYISQKLNDFHYIKTDPVEVLDYLKQAIKKDFPWLPDVNCTIKYVHESLQDYVSPAMYLIPQLDNYNENCIYINNNPEYDMSQIFTTIAHEGYPGHLYQNVYFRNKDIHPIRNILTNLGYEEGWATYAEIYSYSIAGLDSTVAQVLRDNLIATHCIYSRTDIGIHYEGWTYEEASTYLSKYISESSCKAVYQALIEEPGIYLPYCVGYLEIMDLKKTAEEALGTDFNLREFHTFLLDLGPVNFSLLQTRLSDWTKQQINK